MVKQRFAGRSVLVTGGASGIGRAAALAFASEGARVTIGDLDAPGGAAVVDEIQAAGGTAQFIAADCTIEGDVAALVAGAVGAFGPLAHAVNNVGLSRPGTVETTTREDWDWTLATTLTATWLGLKHELPVMLAHGGGAIVNTASMSGKMVTPAAPPAYGAAKAGVIHLTAYASALYAARGVRINSVSPGLVATPVIARMFDAEQQAEIAGGGQSIARAVQPVEIAATVLFLCSDDAAMITGTDTEVCGGRRA
ncbi:SDR family NAD(P)-dependent oxidoreductase [Nitrospirillum viridazoti]|uniref:Short-chain dehydrogenase n=1 Tax=Nitrospirillum viridazoti CBAmc TaxID=1441467 RepID=A0A248JU13_9PROT|nr:SDR family oxidoreductase [Nitrospirillum amazonense]ASG22213.1 short-chain dehydrogenase [Nitrospirillum amazonense CBAmc]TWB31022.1 NAD(P)-dependent dehydrogenase (short-subunit alcohol dehydrogenase family) [Nitrospirillum amazonense]